MEFYADYIRRTQLKYPLIKDLYKRKYQGKLGWLEMKEGLRIGGGEQSTFKPISVTSVSGGASSNQAEEEAARIREQRLKMFKK